MNQEKEVLPPIAQEWYDDNRERFNAETIVFPDAPARERRTFARFNEVHDFKRLSAIEVGCDHCNARWMDHGKWQLHNGNIVKIGDMQVAEGA